MGNEHLRRREDIRRRDARRDGRSFSEVVKGAGNHKKQQWGEEKYVETYTAEIHLEKNPKVFDKLETCIVGRLGRVEALENMSQLLSEVGLEDFK